MRVDGFDFDLPDSSIALEPARPRDSARLLYVRDRGGDNQAETLDKVITDLPDILRPGDMLVANNTKVIPVQLTALRPARMVQTQGKQTSMGGHKTLTSKNIVQNNDIRIDVTLHKQIGESDSEQQWKAFMRPAKRVREGDLLVFGDDFQATIISRDGAEAVLEFPYSPQAFMARLKKAGLPPLPPYIARRRAVTGRDLEDYQTHFAEHEGSVAAPTAGLHFTPALLEALEANDILHQTITLHVGAGTFLPISVEDTDHHIMHSEWGQISPAQAASMNKVRRKGGRLVAVGTTSLRLLESAADDEGIVHPFEAETDIFITPGYRFKAVDCLMTNFHLPRSTLFMLVCAFAGTTNMKTAYRHAIDTGYRFYSYGDACFLERSSSDTR